jgi:hypothetical protein
LEDVSVDLHCSKLVTKIFETGKGDPFILNNEILVNLKQKK